MTDIKVERREHGKVLLKGERGGLGVIGDSRKGSYPIFEAKAHFADGLVPEVRLTREVAKITLQRVVELWDIPLRGNGSW